MPRSFFAISAALVFVAALPLRAGQTLATPQGPVLLTVSGDFLVATDGQTALFDRAGLHALGLHRNTTTTVSTNSAQTFSGVPRSTLMTHLGETGGRLQVSTIDDYAITLPLDPEVTKPAPVAFLRSRATMSVRDKSPLWIVFPFDDHLGYRSELFHARSIWQLYRMEVRN